MTTCVGEGIAALAESRDIHTIYKTPLTMVEDILNRKVRLQYTPPGGAPVQAEPVGDSPVRATEGGGIEVFISLQSPRNDKVATLLWAPVGQLQVVGSQKL